MFTGWLAKINTSQMDITMQWDDSFYVETTQNLAVMGGNSHQERRYYNPLFQSYEDQECQTLLNK